MSVLDLQKMPVLETRKEKTLHPSKDSPGRMSGLSLLLCNGNGPPT